MSVLVTGGAGYIGNATVRALLDEGNEVVVLDDLSVGHREAVPDTAVFYQGTAGNAALVREIVLKHRIESCVHFAGSAYVGESVADPAKYFGNNTVETHSLLSAIIESGAKTFVFSSSCATYGNPVKLPIDEDHPQQPVNPYGWSKLAIEKMLAAYSTAYGLRYMALRYFNAAGATDACGEVHEPETHLIPLVLRAAAGEMGHVDVFGSDYPTPDGTCIRDYVHIADLATAHILALRYLAGGGESIGVNIGSGQGASVLEVIEKARQLTGRPIALECRPRRPGDPPQLVADCSLAQAVLGFTTQHSSLETIISSAWRWKTANPNGYPD